MHLVEFELFIYIHILHFVSSFFLSSIRMVLEILDSPQTNISENIQNGQYIKEKKKGVGVY